MEFWNFCHNTVGLHVYEFLALVIAVVMLVIAVVFILRDRQRKKDYETKLEELKQSSAPSGAETPSYAGEGGNVL